MNVMELFQQNLTELAIDDADTNNLALSVFQRLNQVSGPVKIRRKNEIINRYSLAPLGFPDLYIYEHEHAHNSNDKVKGYFTALPTGKYVIGIYTSIDKIRSSLEGLKYFSHEFIHYLDDKRGASNTYYSSDVPNNADDYRKWKEQYYNNPSEYNAYYFNIADDILLYITYLQSDDAEFYLEMREDYLGDNLFDYINNLNMSEKNFIANLNPVYRKKFLKRIASAYHQADELYKKVSTSR